jgi:hypothetical protein
MDDFLERIITEPLTLVEEVGFDPIILVLSHEHRDGKPLSQKQLMEGRLATALLVFDHILGDCRKGLCPKLKKEWCFILDDLSIDRCIQMKAFHIWTHQRRPFPSSPDQTKADYISACEDSWAISYCPETMSEGPARVIQDFYAGRQLSMKNKKALWQSETRLDALHRDHFCDASGYVESFYSILNGGSEPDDLKKFVQRNGSMMSVLEFLFLACKCPIKSAAQFA